MSLDVLRGRGPAVGRFEVAAKPASERGVGAGLLTSDGELELSIRALRCSCPDVEGDLRIRTDEEETLPVLLGELPPLWKRALGIGSCGDQIGIVVLAIKETHSGRILSGPDASEGSPASSDVFGAARLGTISDWMTSRTSRREKNQELFRKGNEGLHGAVEGVVSAAAVVPFLCECADDGCDGRIEITLGDWESVASEPNHYVIVAGHLRSEGEEIVGSLGEYDVVRKPD